MAKPSHIIIVGGGLAGIAAAVALAQAPLDPPLRVTLIEARHSLGGRASSFEDPQNPGVQLDNCQHVLLGCCTNLLDLYRRLGVLNKITFHKTIHFLDAAGKRHDLRAVQSLPAPLHLGPSLACFSLLTPKERFAAIRACFAMLRIGKADRDKLEPLPFGQWLDEHNQPPSLIKKFYDPILLSALNEDIRLVSAKYAIQVFQDAMFVHAKGYLVGLANCPLSQLYSPPPPPPTHPPPPPPPPPKASTSASTPASTKSSSPPLQHSACNMRRSLPSPPVPSASNSVTAPLSPPTLLSSPPTTMTSSVGFLIL